MTTLLAILLLILLGIILLLVEFALIPGITIAGIGALVLFVISVYLAFSSYGTTAGFITLFSILIITPLLVFYFFKSKYSKRMILKSEIDGTVPKVEEENIKVGDTGVTITRLAPIGKIKINDIVVEGKSTGQLIDQQTEIEVIKILKNQIIVKSKNELL